MPVDASIVEAPDTTPVSLMPTALPCICPSVPSNLTIRLSLLGLASTLPSNKPVKELAISKNPRTVVLVLEETKSPSPSITGTVLIVRSGNLISPLGSKMRLPDSLEIVLPSILILSAWIKSLLTMTLPKATLQKNNTAKSILLRVVVKS